MALAEWEYAKRGGHIVRRRSAGRREVLTNRGWVRLGWVASWWFGRSATKITPATAKRRMRRACCPTVHDMPARPPRRGTWSRVWARRWMFCCARWWLSPPLSDGAPRFFRRKSAVGRAVASYGESLTKPAGGSAGTPQARDELVAQARQGWERALARQQGVEGRAATFVQAAGLTTTVVLVNNALLTGNNRVTGGARWVFVIALVIASGLLLIAGIYGLFATMRTFSRIAPDNPTRIITRARAVDDDSFRLQAIAAMLAAQRRTSLVADWKLARLKRASIAFGLAVVAIALASLAYVSEIAGKEDPAPGKETKPEVSPTAKAPHITTLAPTTVKLDPERGVLVVLPSFEEPITGVVKFVTRDPVRLAGGRKAQLSLASKPFLAVPGNRVRVRFFLSRHAQGALAASGGVLAVRVRISAIGATGLAGHNDAGCLVLRRAHARGDVTC